MSMQILLTGASGFIGQHLSPALLAQGHEVVGCDSIFFAYFNYTGDI